MISFVKKRSEEIDRTTEPNSSVPSVLGRPDSAESKIIAGLVRPVSQQQQNVTQKSGGLSISNLLGLGRSNDPSCSDLPVTSAAAVSDHEVMSATIQNQKADLASKEGSLIEPIVEKPTLHLDLSFPLDIAKLHPTLPPISPMITSQYKEKNSKRNDDHIILEGKNLKRNFPTDGGVVDVKQFSPERQKIFQSLNVLSTDLKKMQAQFSKQSPTGHTVEKCSNKTSKGENLSHKFDMVATDHADKSITCKETVQKVEGREEPMNGVRDGGKMRGLRIDVKNCREPEFDLKGGQGTILLKGVSPEHGEEHVYDNGSSITVYAFCPTFTFYSKFLHP